MARRCDEILGAATRIDAVPLDRAALDARNRARLLVTAGKRGFLRQMVEARMDAADLREDHRSPSENLAAYREDMIELAALALAQAAMASLDSR